MRAAYLAKANPQPKQRLVDWIQQVSDSFMNDPKWQPQYDEYMKTLSSDRLVMYTFKRLYLVAGQHHYESYDTSDVHLDLPRGWTLYDLALVADPPEYKIKAKGHLLDGVVVCLECKREKPSDRDVIAPLGKIVGVRVVIKIPL